MNSFNNGLMNKKLLTKLQKEYKEKEMFRKLYKLDSN